MLQPYQSDEENLPPDFGQPFKIVDVSMENRFGVVATDLKDLIGKACIKLGIPPDVPVRVALELDGTEVEDEDYFSTLERNTTLVILINDEKWLPPRKYRGCRIVVDETDGDASDEKNLHKLVGQLRDDMTSITLLGGRELELLADMDPESIEDFDPGEDRAFLESVKEASSRFLSEKQQAKDALDLLKLYHCRHVARDTAEASTS